MDPGKTALILIGYQNDYFSSKGVLYSFIEESSKVTDVVANTVCLLNFLVPSPLLIVCTPIFFTADYAELIDPVGILKTIKDLGAFRAGSEGSKTIPELRQFRSRIVEVPGKRGLNAFSNTDLDRLLRERGVTDVVLAGAVTSICIDSTGRSAHERGYRVSVLSDCTSARTAFEREYYCKNILPLYADVIDSGQLLQSLGIRA